MKSNIRVFSSIGKALVLFVCFSMAKAWAISPMDYYNSLIAGSENSGYADGAFSQARFDRPCGMAMDADGHWLYIADPGNHRIRSVDLTDNDRVKTVAGTGADGILDGPLAQATFSNPRRLVCLPQSRIAVFDANGGLLRLIDLQTQLVTTLAKGLDLWDMVYRPEDDSLYFSEPNARGIGKVDLKTGTVSMFLDKDPHLASPTFLCLKTDRLCVVDGLSGGAQPFSIYEVPLPGAGQTVGAPPVPQVVGKVENVVGLAATDGTLYALKGNGVLVKVAGDQGDAVKWPASWGFLFQNNDHGGKLPLVYFQDNNAGFMASSTETRKFYLFSMNSILSVRDYDFQKLWSAFQDNDQGYTDFNYPPQKPYRTFRILAIGSSRNSTAVPVPADPQAGINEDDAGADLRVKTYTKRLEFLLNTQAALRGLNIRFEVFNRTHRGRAISTFAYQEVPELVRKYDIDLVIGMTDGSGFWDYYENPLTAEGIPALTAPSGYTQKPLSQRAKSGPAAQVLARCKALKIPVSEKQDCPGGDQWSLFCTGDSLMNQALIEMTGRRLQLLNDKLNTMKTSTGTTPQFMLFYVPDSLFPNDCCSLFWGSVCSYYHMKYVDFSDAYDALKTSYYPTDANHYTVYGNELIGQILTDHFLMNGSEYFPQLLAK